jgi:hypothetical protein
MNTIIAVFFQIFQNFADYSGIIRGPLEAVQWSLNYLTIRVRKADDIS